MTLIGCVIYMLPGSAGDIFKGNPYPANFTIINCLFENNGGASKVHLDQSAYGTSVNSIYYNFGSQTLANMDSTDITSNPLFKDADNDNFELLPNSPAIL